LLRGRILAFKTSQLQANLLQKLGMPKPFSQLSKASCRSQLFNRFRNQKKDGLSFGQAPKLKQITTLPPSNQRK
jgi:hypothetical protein